jgi:small multidrug resistance pump
MAWVACAVGLTAVAARICFKEPLTPHMAVGLLLIAAGVLIVEFGASAAH